jgi:uncharacterized protein
VKRYIFPALCILTLVLALHTLTIASGVPEHLAVESLAVQSADGRRHEFTVHVADTPEARARGLMYVTRLEPDRGMLFDFGTPQLVGMWMKNTPLSLDMLFINEDGVIVHIEALTRPFSTEVLSSGEPVRAVLELLGGRTGKLGIAPGDLVIHRLFPARSADDSEHRPSGI